MAELTMRQKIEAQIAAEAIKQEEKMAKLHDQLEKAESNAIAGINKLKERKAKIEATIVSKTASLETSHETLAKIVETLTIEENALATMQGEDADTNTDNGEYS